MSHCVLSRSALWLQDIFSDNYRPQTKFAKVMFLQVSVCPQGCGRVWQGGMHGGEHVCQGGVHGRGHAWQGACMVGGVHGGGGHAWWWEVGWRACHARTPADITGYGQWAGYWNISYWNAFMFRWKDQMRTWISARVYWIKWRKSSQTCKTPS